MGMDDSAVAQVVERADDDRLLAVVPHAFCSKGTGQSMEDIDMYAR